MATGTMVRVTLKPQGASEEEGNARQLVLDLVMDPETKVSTGPFPAFGRAGDFRKPETLIPFTLMMDGRLDTGAYASDAQRQDVLAIRTATLAEGTLVERSGADGVDVFEIVNVVGLG
jgi:hypothetical protein